MIQSAFSALGITGKNHTTSMWFVDPRASSHMTFSTTSLTNVRKYKGNFELHTSEGQLLPITAIDYIPHSLPLNHLFLSRRLFSHLLFVGQLVDNNCTIHFLIPSVLSKIRSQGV